MWIADLDGRTTYVSPQVEQILGTPVQAWIDDPGRGSGRSTPTLHRISEIVRARPAARPLDHADADITAEVEALVGFRQSAIVLFDESRDRLIYKGGRGLGSTDSVAFKADPDTTFSGVVVRTGQPLVWTASRSRVGFPTPRPPARPGRSWGCRFRLALARIDRAVRLTETSPSLTEPRAGDGARTGVSFVRMQRRPGRVIPFPRRLAQPPPRAGDRRLVEVRRCDQAEAVVVKSLLESADIPAFLRSRLAHSVHPFTVGAQGEVVVLVPQTDVARARRLLAPVDRSALRRLDPARD